MRAVRFLAKTALAEFALSLAPAFCAQPAAKPLTGLVTTTIPTRYGGQIVVGPTIVFLGPNVLDLESTVPGVTTVQLADQSVGLEPVAVPTGWPDYVSSFLSACTHTPDWTSMLCFGGGNITSSAIVTMDLRTLQWTASLPTTIPARRGCSFVTVGSSAYIFGGQVPEPGRVNDIQGHFNDTWKVDLSSGSPAAPVQITANGAPTPRRQMCVGAVGVDAFLVFGGETLIGG
ncbi:hypothetical protein BDK51DRAFT_49798 [Blyttiomyces helicus]|uniref:Galactose oxidase n=1 Tax=Blyttiomyces helicus TaxID=388810 RepID=A0A4P9W0T0_9FUNG|nr:hypothetical protein BDK51DRAFT_49798 [Blyttiomyces helicus]|eukprot:RKO83646.1 hypothetical protein BDK51DRAFT_49798 [Blyttiomyces helicus]